MRLMRLGLAVAALAASLTMASASDIARPTPPRPYIQKTSVYDWTGGYAGVQAGWVSGTAKSSLGTPFGVFDLGSMSQNGFIGGVHLGYDWQPIGSNFIYGVVATANYSSINQNGFKQDWSGNIRGNVGYSFAERWQMYGTGGLAIANVEFNAPPISWSEKRLGYVVGGGVKYAAPNNVIFGVEATWTDLGSKSHDFAPVPVSLENRLTAMMVMAGASVKF